MGDDPQGQPEHVAKKVKAVSDVSIELTEQEGETFDIIQKARDHANLQTVLRVAGGWVRDKVRAAKTQPRHIAMPSAVQSECRACRSWGSPATTSTSRSTT